MQSSSIPEHTIKLTELDTAIKGALSRQKYSLIFDKTGNAEVFFRYKAHLVEVNKLSIAISMDRKT